MLETKQGDKTFCPPCTKLGKMLHVGCGGEHLPEWLADQGYDEVRLDIDPQFKPDILASMTDLGDIGTYEGIFCSHSLEHLYPHEVQIALREFLRVLSPGGALILFVPDLEDIRATEDVVYVSPSGPITGLDMFYGYRRLLSSMPYMAHHTGFVSSTLRALLEEAGFNRVTTKRIPTANLMGVGVKDGWDG